MVFNMDFSKLGINLFAGLLVFFVTFNVLNQLTAELIKQKMISKIWLLDPFVLYHYIK